MSARTASKATNARSAITLARLRQRPFVSKYASLSDVGLIRDENQDCYGVYPEDGNALKTAKGQIFIVADGMGGHARGAEAARLAVHYVQEVYFADDSEKITDSLRKAFETANAQILKCWQNGGTFERMGTTCTALVFAQGKVYLGHVGDSKAYRITKNSFEQISQDHTHVAELRRRGILTESEAKTNPRRSELVRAVGMAQEIEVDVLEVAPIRIDETYVLCTDGLEQVSAEEMRLNVQTHDPERACRELVELEKSRGGRDNITVQVIAFERPVDKRPAQKNRIRMAPHSDEDAHKNLKRGFAVLGLLMLLGLLLRFNAPLRNTVMGLLFKPASPPATSLEPSELAQQAVEPDTIPDSLAILAVDSVALDSVIAEESTAENTESSESGGETGIPESASTTAGALLTSRTPTFTVPDISPPDIEPQAPIVEQTVDTPLPDDLNRAVTRPSSRTLLDGVWRFPGLVENRDYVRREDGFSMLETVGLKKAIYGRIVTDFDFEVTFEHPKDLEEGQVGAFVGYRRVKNTEYYYQVYLKQDGKFALVRYYDYKRELIRPLDLHLKRVKEGPLNLRVRCVGPWLIVYLNNRLVNAWQNANHDIAGEVGFFVGSEKTVTFSNIRVSSMAEQQASN